jgi:hypothetical protein
MVSTIRNVQLRIEQDLAPDGGHVRGERAHLLSAQVPRAENDRSPTPMTKEEPAVLHHSPAKLQHEFHRSAHYGLIPEIQPCTFAAVLGL